jgi:hypothetical protein
MCFQLPPYHSVVRLSGTASPPAGVFAQYRALFCASVTHFLLFLLLRLYRLVSVSAALPNICTRAMTKMVGPQLALCLHCNRLTQKALLTVRVFLRTNGGRPTKLHQEHLSLMTGRTCVQALEFLHCPHDRVWHRPGYYPVYIVQKIGKSTFSPVLRLCWIGLQAFPLHLQEAGCTEPSACAKDDQRCS